MEQNNITSAKRKKKSLLLLVIQLIIAVGLVLLMQIPVVWETVVTYWEKIAAKGTVLQIIFFGMLAVALLFDAAYILAPFCPRAFAPVTNFFHKLNSASPAAKASFWFVASNIILRGISFITTPIFTRLLDPSDYGITSVFTSWESVIGVFATLSLSGGVYNVAMLKYKDDVDGYTSCMIGLTSISLTLVYGLCIAVNLIYPQLFEISTSYLVYMAIQSFTNAVISFWLMRKRFIYDYKSVLRYTISNAILSPLCSIIAILLFPQSKAYAKIFGAGISGIVIGIVICVQTMIRGKKVYNKEYYRYALKFNLPLIPHYLSSTLLNSSDKIMINSIISAAQAGLYSIAHSITGLISIITHAINHSLIPMTLKSIKEKRFRHLRNTTTGCMLIVSVVCMFVTLFAQEMVQIFATPEYVSASLFVAPLSFSVLIYFVSGILGNILFYHEKTWYMTAFTTISAVVNLVTNYVFIHLVGAIAAGYTTLASSFITFFLYYWAAKREEEHLHEIFNMKWILLIFAGYAAFTVYSIVFYSNLYARLAIMAAVILLLVIFHKKILLTVKQMKER